MAPRTKKLEPPRRGRDGRYLPGSGRVNYGNCSVAGCTNVAQKTGWCGGHYFRWRKYGDVFADRPLRKVAYVDPLAMSKILAENEGRDVGTQIIMATCGDELIPVLFDANFVAPRAISVQAATGYAQMMLNHKLTMLHRYVLGLSPGDGLIADHINGDRLDNRWSNLRTVDITGSNQNLSGWGRSKYLGVHKKRNRWVASCTMDYKAIVIGTFATEEEAARASHEWRLKNFPHYVDRHLNGRVGDES